MKSDVGHDLTEIELEKLIKKISGVYAQCSKDVQQTAAEYFEKLKVRDKIKQERLAKGIITEQEYKTWKIAQIGRGKNFEALADKLAERVTGANELAIDYVNNALPAMYAINRNYAAFTIEKGGNELDFTLWDEKTVKRLLVDSPETMPYYPEQRAIDRGIDLAYGKSQITKQVTSSILQGTSIDDMAKKLAESISGMSMNSAVRAARTATTSAETAGRLDSYYQAEEMGIKMEKEWMATRDNRTRDSHAMLDGEHVPIKKKFSNGCMHPADPEGKPSEVYNCRCTLVAWFPELKEQNDNRYTWSKWAKDQVAKTGDMTIAQKLARIQGKAQKAQQTVIPTALKPNPTTYQDFIDRGKAILENPEYTKYFDEVKAELEETKELRSKYNKEWHVFLDKQKRGELTFKEYQAQTKDIKNKLHELDDKIEYLRSNGQAYKKIIQTVRNETMGWKNLYKTDKELIKDVFEGKYTDKKAAIAGALEYYPESWVKVFIKGVYDRRNKNYSKWICENRERAAYTGHSIALSEGGYYGIIEAVHELGHAFEEIVDLYDITEEFYRYRTAGSELKWLGSGYAKNEKYRSGGFFHVYCGKEYGDTKKHEILSMGYENLFCSERQSVDIDEEYKNFLLGVITYF